MERNMENEPVYYDDNSPRLTAQQLEELDIALEDVKAGRTISYDDYMKKLSAKYGIFD